MTVNTESPKLHPHKLLMYIAIGSMTMMFAGWISAYMVREGQGRWDHIQLPSAFYISTALILLSSVTVYLATRAHRKKNFGSYKLFLIATIILGASFISYQISGFSYMYNEMDILLNGNNAAGEFTYVIPFVHGIHVLGGIIALVIMLLLAFWGKNRKNPTSSRGIEIASTFWHFVDALWLFIFIFLMYNQQG
jgi:cytochrome c oxidase subunit 3